MIRITRYFSKHIRVLNRIFNSRNSSLPGQARIPTVGDMVPSLSHLQARLQPAESPTQPKATPDNSFIDPINLISSLLSSRHSLEAPFSHQLNVAMTNFDARYHSLTHIQMFPAPTSNLDRTIKCILYSRVLSFHQLKIKC